MDHPPTTGRATPGLDDVRALEIGALIDRYAGAVHALDTRLLDADAEQASTYFRPEAGVGRWSCRALVAHLADAETVMVHRMRRTLCEESPVLALWDEDAFIDACVSDGTETSGPPPVAGAVGAVHALRLWTADWLRTLEDDAWSRIALHPERGELTLRSLLDDGVWHFEHHARFLSLKLDKLLGPREDAT